MIQLGIYSQQINRRIVMKMLLLSLVIFTNTFVYAQNKAPDDVVTKDDINNCYKDILKTEISFNPHYLKVESAHYTVEDVKILLTLNIREKNDYGAPVALHERQCTLDK